MIDFEVKIFNKVHEVVSPLCAKNRFVSTPIESYTKLPAAALWEMDSTTVRRRQSSEATENFSRVTYQGEVVAETKAKCREIFGAMDGKMIQLNFSRISGQYITYPDNVKIVRYVARWEAEMDPDGNLYRVP